MQKKEMVDAADQVPPVPAAEKILAQSRNKMVAKPMYQSLKDQRSLNGSKIRAGGTAVSSVRNNNNKTPITAKFGAV
jgi:hypothetical protein